MLLFKLTGVDIGKPLRKVCHDVVLRNAASVGLGSVAQTKLNVHGQGTKINSSSSTFVIMGRPIGAK